MVGRKWLLVSVAVAFSAGAACCQTIDQLPAKPIATVTEVVVTGSHIPAPAGAHAGPIAIVGRDQIAQFGDTRVEDALKRLPQALPGQSIEDNNGATGIATANLRGLGEQRTLVLLDGKRLMPGDPVNGSIAPDLNFIPTALIDRIEIVTGGASAVYGSDAIAGVVNFITRPSISGLSLESEVGVFDHHNGQTSLDPALRAQGDPIPPANLNDGLVYDVNLAAGAKTRDDRISLMVYGGLRQTEPVDQSQRDFSACALVASGPDLFCQGATSSPALTRFIPLDIQTLTFWTLDPTGAAGALRPFNFQLDGYNYAPFNYFQRSDRRWTAGVFARAAISPHVEAYVQAMFMDDVSTAQEAPSGLFNLPVSLSCASPLLSAAEEQDLCAAAGVPVTGSTDLAIARRNVEGGPRHLRYEHRDWRLLAGVRGEIGSWTWDISLQRGAVDFHEQILNEVSLARATDALNVVVGPSGALVCASGNPGCAPYDIFRIGGVTPAALAYIAAQAAAAGGTGETVASATLAGNLGDGLRSPWAREGLGVAVGVEYRRDDFDFAPDAEYASGDLADTSGPRPAVAGATDVVETYGEARAPLIQADRWPLGEVILEGGYRLSRYNRAGLSWTYKAGGQWAPIPDIRFRASFNHAVRAPNVDELFTPQTLQSGLNEDPCAGANPIAFNMNPMATAANCARTGVTAAQYGAITPDVNQYNSLNGGNADLKPETADTVTFGVELTPRFAPRLRLTLDAYAIDIRGAIEPIGADAIVEQCLDTGNPLLCKLIHRAPGTGSLWLSPQGYVIDIDQNLAVQRASGLDVAANWRGGLPKLAGRDIGSIGLDFNGAWTRSFFTQTVPGGQGYDCAGLYGSICGQPIPTWRHILRATWMTPWRFDLEVAWRFIGPVKFDGTSSNPVLAQDGPVDAANAQLDERDYIDLSLTWRASRRITVTAGVNNLFDRDPPIFGLQGGLGNGNTFPSTYDALGRFAFVRLTARD